MSRRIQAKSEARRRGKPGIRRDFEKSGTAGQNSAAMSGKLGIFFSVQAIFGTSVHIIFSNGEFHEKRQVPTSRYAQTSFIYMRHPVPKHKGIMHGKVAGSQ